MTRRLDGWEAALAAALIGATLLVYWPALFGTLLWDDAAHITRPELRSLHGLWRIWFDVGATQQYYPLLHSAFWLEHRLWGDAEFGYHLTNVLLHTWSALMLGAILRRLRLPGAWLAAWIFALHPIQVESVAWIAEQKNTLSTALYLTSAFVYLGFDRTRNVGRYLLATALFVAAVSSKTTTTTLPAALLVVIWWSHGTVNGRRDLVPLIPWFLLAIAGGLTTAWFERTYIGATGPDFDLTLLERALLAGRIVAFYAWTLVWPTDLMFNYPRWVVDASRSWQYLFPAGVALVLVGTWRARARRRGPMAASLLFVGTLGPALGVVNVYPFIYSYVADHFAYLASASAIAAASWMLVRVSDRILPAPRVGPLPILGLIVVVVLGRMTWIQSHVYRNVETLYRTTMAKNPESWMAHENMGVLLAAVPGRRSEAAALFETATHLRPEAGRRRNYALALADLPGREPDAIVEFETLVRMPGASGSDHAALARLLGRTPGREQEALVHLWHAVELSPSDAGARNALAKALVQESDPRAEEQYRRAIALKPDFAEAYYNLANLLVRDPRRTTEARVHYFRALSSRPEYAEAHYNLGTSLMEEPDRNRDAVAHLTAAVLLRPDDGRMRTNLALALAGQPGRTDDVIRHLEAAVKSAPSLDQPRELLERLRAAQFETSTSSKNPRRSSSASPTSVPRRADEAAPRTMASSRE